MNLPIFAADWVGAIIGILFLLISAASAISNAAKEKNKAQPGKAREKAQLQKELEKFLQDAMNPQQKKKPEPVQASAEPTEIDFFEEDGIEAVSSTPEPRRQRRQRQAAQSRRRQSQAGQPTGGAQARSSEPPKKQKRHVSLRERNKLEEAERQNRLGGSLRDQIKKRKKKHIQPRVHSQIDSKVSQHLSETFGNFSDKEKSIVSRKVGGRQIREMLRDPQSFRQAIILSEILSPPRSRRRS